MPDMKAKLGRPRKEGRSPFNFRISDDLRQRLTESAGKANRSLTEEAEFRLNRDLQHEADLEKARAEIEEKSREMKAWHSAEYLNVLRLVGYQILREIDARPTRVIVDLQSLRAEADGIARGLRSGFIDSNAQPSNASITRTAEEDRQLLHELEQTKRKLAQALEQTRAADAAAGKAKKRSA